MSKKYHCVDYKILGSRIVKRRSELGLSQRALADLIDCDVSYLSKIENGKSAPTLDLICIIAKHLGTGLDYLVLDTADGANILKAELQNIWNGCSSETVKFLYQITEIAKDYETNLINTKINDTEY
jgi:transcriptional regulator with XRE-family HTH domain